LAFILWKAGKIHPDIHRREARGHGLQAPHLGMQLDGIRCQRERGYEYQSGEKLFHRQVPVANAQYAAAVTTFSP